MLPIKNFAKHTCSLSLKTGEKGPPGLINPLKFDFNYANYYSSVLLLGQCFSSLSTFSPIFPEFI